MTSKDYWEGVADDYDHLYNNPWSTYEDLHTQKILRREFALAPGPRVLDIGCGNGLGYRLIGGNRVQQSYTGLDISKKMIDQLRSRHKEVRAINVRAEDGLVALADKSFDFVISINTAASFPSDTKIMLENINRILTRNGRFCLSFLNRWSFRRLVTGKFGKFENYRTRRDTHSTSSVQAHTLTRHEFFHSVKHTFLTCERVEYQSVLGGVWETKRALRIQCALAPIVGWMGHAIIFSGAKR